MTKSKRILLLLAGLLLACSFNHANAAEDNYWKIKEGDLVLRVDKGTGVISNFSQGESKIAEQIFTRYKIQDKDREEESDGYQDQVIEQKWEGQTLNLKLTNKKLPGLEINKRLRLAGGRIEEEIRFRNIDRDPEAFLELTTEVVLDKDYRKEGVYETWGSTLKIARKFASEITADFPASEETVMSFDKPSRQNCLLHYRYRRNGAYMPLGANIGIFMFSPALTNVFTPTGWRLQSGLFKLDRNREQSVETHLALVSGTLLEAYNAYLDLPEVQEFRNSIRRAEWVKDSRLAGSINSWLAVYPGVAERLLQRDLLLLREGCFVEGLTDSGCFVWGDYPTSGIVRTLFGGAQTAEELRDKIANLHALSPRGKISLYTWLWSAEPSTSPYQKHPEWFATKTKEGQRWSFYSGYRPNYRRLASIKESQDEMFEQVHRMMNYYNADMWYLDGGQVESFIDWQNMRLDEPEGWFDLHRRLRKTLLAENPERAFFFNCSENPLADFGIYETGSWSTVISAGSPLWRSGAAVMWKFKLWQYRDPDRFTTYLYWTPATEGPYEYYVAGLGILPTYSGRTISARDVPYLSAQHEIKSLSLANAGFSPDWRSDEKTSLESYSLVQGPAGFIFLQSHAKESATEKVGVDLVPLGLNEEKKPVYQWAFQVQDARRSPGRLGEPELEKIYRDTGWRLDSAVKAEFLGSAKWQPRIERTFSFKPDELTPWVLTQSPGLVYSVDGLPCQYWLPETLGVKVIGQVTENRIKLQVDSNRQKAEIVAVIPEEYAPAATTVAGKNVRTKILANGTARLVLIPVGKGSQEVVVQLAKETFSPALTLPRVTVSNFSPGSNGLARIELSDDWLGRNLLMSVTKDGIVRWFDSTVVNAPAFEVSVAVPRAVDGGDYRFIVSDVSAQKISERTFTLLAGKPETVIPPIWIELERETKVTESRVSSAGIEITGFGWEYSKGAGKVSVVPEKKTINVATLPMPKSLWSSAAGGLEMKAERYLKLRFSGNFYYFNPFGSEVIMLSLFAGDPYCFAGMMLDFKTPGGYTTRTAAKMGHTPNGYAANAFEIGTVNREIIGTTPNAWGTKQKPNNTYLLSNFALEKDASREMWVDLRQLGAPPDWDGGLWLTLSLGIINPDRQFSVEVLETAAQLPAGATVTQPQ